MKKPKMMLRNLDVLQWLFDPVGNRATGRSYTMAIAYINLSCSSSQWITVRDHFPTQQADDCLMDMIKNICKKQFPEIRFQFKRNEFRVAR